MDVIYQNKKFKIFCSKCLSTLSFLEKDEMQENIRLNDKIIGEQYYICCPICNNKIITVFDVFPFYDYNKIEL